MQHRQYPHMIGVDLVSDHERQAGNDQFARAGNATRLALVRKLPKSSNGLADTATYVRAACSRSLAM